jgi:hypothetical protein
MWGREAVNAFQDGKIGFQRAADTFYVPMMTISRRVKKEGDVTVVSKK